MREIRTGQEGYSWLACYSFGFILMYMNEHTKKYKNLFKSQSVSKVCKNSK
jgi:hypothetical protein